MKKTKTLFSEFKKFISKGSVVDMAIGVIMGTAFGAIINAVVKILMSICTWGVPGGINGLITVLPALNKTQAGVSGIGQTFMASEIREKTFAFATSQGLTIDPNDTSAYINCQKSLLSKYTLHGDRYFYNASAIIEWSALINAIVSFLIIAIVLFIILKIYTSLQRKRETLNEKKLELYYSKHPEERPAPVEEDKPEIPQPTEIEILTQIRDSLVNKNNN